MQDKDIQALKALAEKATPGPWFANDWSNDFGDDKTTVEARQPEILRPGQSSIWTGGIRCMRVAETEAGERPIDDAAYIAAANPQAILSLIASHEQQAARIAELTEEVALTDKLLAERNRVLQAIPGCEAHGNQCVPHALEWIANAQRPAVDLSGLTRYGWVEDTTLGAIDLRKRQNGEYVKLSDVQALLSTANAAEPVAWIVYALYDGKMIPQYPAMASEADAEAHAAMYTADSKAEVRPLFSTANAAQAGVREQALEEAANVVASTNTLGMTAPAAITRLCAAIRTLKSTPSPSVNSKEGGK